MTEISSTFAGRSTWEGTCEAVDISQPETKEGSNSTNMQSVFLMGAVGSGSLAKKPKLPCILALSQAILSTVETINVLKNGKDWIQARDAKSQDPSISWKIYQLTSKTNTYLILFDFLRYALVASIYRPSYFYETALAIMLQETPIGMGIAYKKVAVACNDGGTGLAEKIKKIQDKIHITPPAKSEVANVSHDFSEDLLEYLPTLSPEARQSLITQSQTAAILFVIGALILSPVGL